MNIEADIEYAQELDRYYKQQNRNELEYIMSDDFYNDMSDYVEEEECENIK